MKVVYMTNYHLNNLCNKYISVVYGMICRCIPQPDLAAQVAQEVFARLKEENFKTDPGLFKIMDITRQVTGSFISNNKALFAENAVEDCAEHDYAHIFQLVCFGRYTTDQLARSLDIDEAVIKQRLHLGIQEFRQQLRAVPGMSR